MSGRKGHDVLTLWTADPDLAARAAAAGVDRIGVDLETVGKAARQAGHGTWISPHRIEDLAPLREKIAGSELFARCNPLHEGTLAEIQSLLVAGARVLMIPNLTAFVQLDTVARMIDGRATIVPLIERTAGVEMIAAMPTIGISEIHVGLNDLSIDLGFANRLKVLVHPVMDRIALLAADAGIRLGIGGLARAGDSSLPVPSDLVLAQHARLGASGALISRSFKAGDLDGPALSREIAALRQRLSFWRSASPGLRDEARQRLWQFTRGAT